MSAEEHATKCLDTQVLLYCVYSIRNLLSPMKTLIGIIVVALIGWGVYALGSSMGWWGSSVPRNLPTAEERERIRAVEDARLEEAPDAQAGIQVREPGSTPPPAPASEPREVASTTTSTSTDTGTEVSP